MQEKSFSELQRLMTVLHEGCVQAEEEHRARCVWGVEWVEGGGYWGVLGGWGVLGSGIGGGGRGGVLHSTERNRVNQSTLPHYIFLVNPLMSI